jgi:hypothetical protein
MQCRACLSNTAFKETQAEAENAWNMRAHPVMPLSKTIINDDLFYLAGAVYARNPKSELYYCNAAPGIEGSKGKRIAKKVYLEALEKCKGGP